MLFFFLCVCVCVLLLGVMVIRFLWLSSFEGPAQKEIMSVNKLEVQDLFLFDASKNDIVRDSIFLSCCKAAFVERPRKNLLQNFALTKINQIGRGLEPIGWFSRRGICEFHDLATVRVFVSGDVARSPHAATLGRSGEISLYGIARIFKYCSANKLKLSELRVEQSHSTSHDFSEEKCKLRVSIRLLEKVICFLFI